MPDLPDSASRPGSDENTGSVAARQMRALLNRHGVPPMRHVTLIAGILDFGYTQVHRRMNGGVAWEVEEIQKVAAHFGESLAEVFTETQGREFIAAVLAVEGARIPCQLILGDAISNPDRNSLVAIQVGAQWAVVAASAAGVGPCYRVDLLQLTSETARPKCIAILDDDVDEVTSLASYFTARGCEAHAFIDTEALLRAMKLRRFDGFVIDWILREGSASELVALIRAEDRECPIAILSGKMEDDVRLEMDVAEALATHKLMFFQKPTRLALLSSQVLRAMGR